MRRRNLLKTLLVAPFAAKKAAEVELLSARVVQRLPPPTVTLDHQIHRTASAVNFAHIHRPRKEDKE